MLSQADACLVERDQRLPGLALLLDPCAFQATLQRALPDLRLGAVNFHYLRYKPGMNCLSAFTLDVDGESIRGYAKTYRPDDRCKLRKAVERPSAGGPLGSGRLILIDDAVEVVIFPNDNKLKALRSLFDAAAEPTLVSRVLGDRPELDAATVSQLRYKPERRFVARLDIDGEPRAVLKLYTRSAYSAAWAAATTLDASGVPIGHSTRHGVLAFEWRDGTPLGDLNDGPESGLVAVERVGATLAELHSRDGVGLLVRDRESEATALNTTADGLRFLHPPVGRLVDDLVRRLSSGLLHAPAVRRTIHGDFYDRQVLVDGERIVVLDLDEAVLSDPAADLGLFIAHLERGAVSRDVPEERVAQVRDALLTGYGAVPERVDLYTAIGLLQLAPHHFRDREPGWPERIEATLERAHNIASRRETSGM